MENGPGVKKVESRVAYLARLSEMAGTHRHAWSLRSERTGTDESRREKLSATLRFFDQEQQLEVLDKRLRNEPPTSGLSPSLREVVEQIAGDLEEYLQSSDIERYRRTTVGLLPLSGVDAFCVDRTIWKEPLDGYLVIMNEGLFMCMQLLSKAFLLENLGGEYADQRTSGSSLQHAAVQNFLSPSPASAGLVMFDHVSPDVEGMLAASQMAMTVVLTQFVLLHEHGHIANGDFELIGKYQFHIAGSGQKRPELTQEHWAAEFAADKFALEAICDKVQKRTSCWANLSAILVFFNLLEAVEDALGEPICPLHPPPGERAERLVSYMNGRFPADAETRDLIPAAQEIFLRWKQERCSLNNAPQDSERFTK